MTPLRCTLSSLLLALALGLPSAQAENAPVNSELNSSMLYALLVAEISAQGGDAGTAYQVMLDAAQRNRSSQLFERAVEIALRARAGDSALQAAQAWTRAQPDAKDATRYLIQILVGLNRLPETVEPMKQELSRFQPADRMAAIRLLPRYFVRVSDKQQALKAVEQALAADLSKPLTAAAAHAAIGTMRLLAGDGEGALNQARKGAALSPAAEDPALLALALMDPKLPGAEALVVQHLQTGAKPELHMAYVRKLLEAQRFQDAKTQATHLTVAAPDFADAWLVRGSLAFQEKNTQEARTALEAFVQRKQNAAPTPNDDSRDKGLLQAYFMLTDLAEQARQWNEAERYLSLIDAPQDRLRVQGRRAVLLARQGKLEEGRALIRAAPEIQAEDARTKLSLEVQLLRDNKQVQSTYDLLLQAVQSYPGDPDLLYDLAMAAEKLNKLEEMETLLRQVIAAKPDYHHAYNALGYSLADRKLRLDEARTLVRKALEFAPEDPFIQDSLGWVEFRAGNLDLALQILQSAYKARPDAEIAAHLGEVLWSLQQQAQARAIWKDGLAQNPDNDTLNETVKRLSTP